MVAGFMEAGGGAGGAGLAVVAGAGCVVASAGACAVVAAPGVPVAFGAGVAIAGHGLGVFAMATSGRPGARTVVPRPSTGEVGGSGYMDWGNSPIDAYNRSKSITSAPTT